MKKNLIKIVLPLLLISEMGYTQEPQQAPGAFPSTSTLKGPYEKKITKNDLVGDWHIMANGRVFTITIKNNQGDLVIDGHSMGDISQVTWTKNRILTFLREVPNTDISQQYTGYFMTYSKGQYHTNGEPRKDAIADYKRRMAGFFEQLSPLLDEEEMIAGWYATRPANEPNNKKEKSFTLSKDNLRIDRTQNLNTSFDSVPSNLDTISAGITYDF